MGFYVGSGAGIGGGVEPGCVVADAGVPRFGQKPGVAFGPGFSVRPDVRSMHLAGKGGDCLF
ncbi:hypothetical protein [[Bacillus] enclensis]|uniref:hypothetical protein n=1 Tax=[Bacillus] enclensis TaxID=1402860 RepID=UPI0018DCF2A5|nr:hypothetical protein [[Bacillus] enclensis]MBH9968779.1 hypothetical protein [[Bacillus] enclensis]